MLTKAISAPIGHGITGFVAASAMLEANGRRIIIVYDNKAMLLQWMRYIPNAGALSIHNCINQEIDDDAIYIVSEMLNLSFCRIVGKLHSARADVWLVNRNLPRVMQ